MISPELKKEVIEYFNTQENNTMREIAKHFGLTYWQVTQIINNYLEAKSIGN